MGWFQVDHKTFDNVVIGLSPSACKVYMKLLRHADVEGYCYPSYKTLSSSLKLSKTTISKSLRELQESGLLNVDSCRSSNEYTVKNGCLRQSSPDSRQYSSPEISQCSKKIISEQEGYRAGTTEKGEASREGGSPKSGLDSLENRLVGLETILESFSSLENRLKGVEERLFSMQKSAENGQGSTENGQVQKVNQREVVQKMDLGSTENELEAVQKMDSNKKHGTRHKEQEEEVLSALPTPFEEVAKSKVEAKKLEVAKRSVRAEKGSSRKTIENMSDEEIEACWNGKIEFEKEWSIEKLWEGEEKAVEVEVVEEEAGYEKLFSRERRNEQQQRIEAVTNLLCVDEKLYSAARIAREIVPLVSLGAKAEDFETWLRWWKEYDFRGRQGDRPANIKVVIHYWRQAMEWKKNGCKKAKIGYEKKSLTERIKESWEELERSMSL